MADVPGFSVGDGRFLMNHDQGLEGYKRRHRRKMHF